MMYTELYSFEGTSATDAGKTESTLEKAAVLQRFWEAFDRVCVRGHPRTGNNGRNCLKKSVQRSFFVVMRGV